MNVHTLPELRDMQVDVTFRTSPWAAIVLPAVLLAICLALGWAMLTGHAPGGVFWAAWILFALAVPFTLRVNVIPALHRATNWVLKVKGDRLYLMLRNWRNTHLSDDVPVVVSFDASEIESVGQQVKRISIFDSPGRRREWKERRLEIRLRQPVPQEFITILKGQPEWSDTLSLFHGWLQTRSRNAASLVSYDDRTIRIVWRSAQEGIWPPIKPAIAMLSRFVPIHDTVTVDRSQPMRLADSQFDDYILQLCQEGDTMVAINLLRERRNYSITDAKQFIDQLKR